MSVYMLKVLSRLLIYLCDSLIEEPSDKGKAKRIVIFMVYPAVYPWNMRDGK